MIKSVTLLFRAILSEIQVVGKRLWSFLFWNSKGVRITLAAQISTKARLEGCSFFGNTLITDEAMVGRATYGRNVFIEHATIGEFCSLGPGCKIGLEEHDLENYSSHPSTYDSAAFVKTKGRAVIEDHVWLGADVIVRQGVHIGKNAVIGAGSVVTKDIPAAEIWGGVPAKFIRKRWVKEV